MTVQTPSRWLDVEQVGDVTIVRFAPIALVDDEVVADIRERLFALVERENCHLLLLNFSRIKGLASRMLGQVMALHLRLRALGGRLVLCEATPFLRPFFERTNLPGLLFVQAGEQKALQALTGSA